MILGARAVPLDRRTRDTAVTGARVAKPSVVAATLAVIVFASAPVVRTGA